MNRLAISTSNISVLFQSLTLCLSGMVIAMSASAQSYESPKNIALADSVPSALIKGSVGSISETVSNDGMLNTYVITAPQGEFSVTTTHGLCKLVREVNAIQEIAVLEKTEAFSDSAVAAAKNLGQGAKSLVTRPGEVIKNAAKGVGEIFRDLGDRIERGDESSEAEDSGIESFIGFSKAKRDYAYQFGVDAYSNNATLQHYLEQISWAGFSGGIAFNVATTVATSGLAGAAISVTNYSAALEDIIRDTTPGDLRELTREKLGEQGINEDLVNLFIGNAELSPRHQAYIAGAMMMMNGVEGKELLIRRAAHEASYEGGFDRQVQNQMYAHIHAEKPLKRFVSIGDDRFVAEAVDGSVVLAATGDYVLWTENLDELMQYKNSRITELGLDGKRHLWLLGSVSENAQDGLDNLGWSVRPNLVNDYLDTLCNPAVQEVTLEAE